MPNPPELSGTGAHRRSAHRLRRRSANCEDRRMKNKKDIIDNWLPRYTGTPLDGFGQHVLLTNFGHYVEVFAEDRKSVV